MVSGTTVAMVNVEYYTLSGTTVYHVMLLSMSNLLFTKRLGCTKENDNKELTVSETTEVNFPETELIFAAGRHTAPLTKAIITKPLSISNLNHLYSSRGINAES
jgi:hypothetical protein